MAFVDPTIIDLSTLWDDVPQLLDGHERLQSAQPNPDIPNLRYLFSHSSFCILAHPADQRNRIFDIADMPFTAVIYTADIEKLAFYA